MYTSFFILKTTLVCNYFLQIITGQWAWWSTKSLTDPRIVRLMVPIPLVPMTMVPVLFSFATSVITWPGFMPCFRYCCVSVTWNRKKVIWNYLSPLCLMQHLSDLIESLLLKKGSIIWAIIFLNNTIYLNIRGITILKGIPDVYAVRTKEIALLGWSPKRWQLI